MTTRKSRTAVGLRRDDENADEPELPEGYVLVNGDWPLHAEHDAWLIETEHMAQVRPGAVPAEPPRTSRDTPAPDPP